MSVVTDDIIDSTSHKMADKQSIRFVILSDTHELDYAFPESLEPIASNVDVILHCGNITITGGAESCGRALDQMKALSASVELVLVIAGNRDSSLDPEWWDAHPTQIAYNPKESVKALELFEQAKIHHIHLLDEGTHIFKLRDGRSFKIFASPYTPDMGGMNAFTYGPDDEHFVTGTSLIPDGVDLVMTHGPPRAIPGSGLVLDLDHNLHRASFHDGSWMLLEAVRRVKPALHCFGAIHDGYGAQFLDWTEEKAGKLEEHGILKTARGDSTFLVNASIFTGRFGMPFKLNKPWVVDIELS